jgi:hypothetical protein
MVRPGIRPSWASRSVTRGEDRLYSAGGKPFAERNATIFFALASRLFWTATRSSPVALKTIGHIARFAGTSFSEKPRTVT